MVTLVIKVGTSALNACEEIRCPEKPPSFRDSSLGVWVRDFSESRHIVGHGIAGPVN